jgi:flagellar biogenesis protein FliO
MTLSPDCVAEVRAGSTSMVGRLAAWLTARLGNRSEASSRRLRHVETLPLGLKRQLLLIECDGERFLVAVTGDSVSAPVPLTRACAAVCHPECRP